MKKYIWLAVATGLAITAVLGLGNIFKEKPITVSVVTVEQKAVQETVKCDGKVQAGNSKEVFVDAPCVAGTVYVSQGQKVNKGDALFSVNTEATKEVLSQMAGTSLGATELPLKTEITAPVSGVVSVLNVREGQTADYTQPCAVITSDSSRKIAVTVREQYLPLVKVGQAVTVSGVAFSKTYHGTVESIGSTARQQYVGTVSETVVDAVVSLEDDANDSALRVGVNAQATIVVSTTENAMPIPYETIAQDENGKEFVYVYDGQGYARRREVQLGRETAEGVLVVSGISAGERLVQYPEQLSGNQVAVWVA